ncbi:MAG: ABC transporter substrate-binding protein [Anaerolineae bacterium]|nr:ABC transporter substrate-binding protein [Anaerolineae bacterium]
MVNTISRRDFLRVAGLGTIAVAASACATPETVEVVKTVEVEKVVEKTVEVEKVVDRLVTPTPMPDVVTSQGKTMPADAAPLELQIRYNVVAENKHLDVPRDIYNANSVLNWGTEPLLRRNEMMELVPALADSYEVGPDAEYFDFKIREGAMWDDGTPITAQDFEFTYQHMSNPELDTPWVWYYYDIQNIRAHKSGDVPASDVGGVAIDDMTFRVYGEGGSKPHLPSLLAYQAACPVPRHRAEADPEHWADDENGFLSCGPYSLIKWDHNRVMEWEINEYYNGPHVPYIQKLINPIGAPNDLNAWLNKEIDLMSQIPVADLNFIRADPDLNQHLRWYNNFQCDYLALDTMNEPLDNLKLRQALSHAINRDAVVQILAGTVQPAYSLLSPGFPGYNPDLKPIQAFDLEMAQTLLAEAGYPEGKDANGNQLELTITHNARDPKIEFVQSQWQENLGIKVNYEIIEGAAWGQRRAEHSMQIYKGPYEYDYLDPANFLRLFRSVDENGSPRHAWYNDEYDQLYDEATHITDLAERYAAFQDVERILVEEVGAIFLTHMLIYQIWWPYFAGIPKDITGREVYRGLDITFSQVYIRNDIAEWDTPRT